MKSVSQFIHPVLPAKIQEIKVKQNFDGKIKQFPRRIVAKIKQHLTFDCLEKGIYFKDFYITMKSLLMDPNGSFRFLPDGSLILIPDELWVLMNPGSFRLIL